MSEFDTSFGIPRLLEDFRAASGCLNYGLGAALTQDLAGREVVIAYASQLLSYQERNYTITEECLALIWMVCKF